MGQCVFSFAADAGKKMMHRDEEEYVKTEG